MVIIARKQKEFHGVTKFTKLSVVGLIIALSAAYISTIWAIYMDSFVSSIIIVGLISAILTIFSFISYFLFIPIIEKSDKGKIFLYSLILLLISHIIFAFNNNFYLFLILAAFVVILHTLRVTSFGIIVRDFSKDKNVSSNQGIIYTYKNIAWVIGPLIAGFVSANLGINWVFLLSALFILFGIIIFKASDIKDFKGKKTVDSNFIKNFKDFFKDKDRVIAYILSGGVNLWWVLIYLFIPLMIIRSNIGPLWVGYFLFGIAVPLILFEYPFSKYTGKHGFKTMFSIGYLIVAIVCFISFFVSNIFAILSLIVLASVGMAMLEPTTEAYFFDILKSKERYRFYGPYNTAIDVGQFTGKFFASILLIFLPFNYIFLFFGIIMFSLFLLSFKTKKIIEYRRR